MEVSKLNITDRIVHCMNEVNVGVVRGSYRPFKAISELDEEYRNKITALSEKYNVSEKTIYSIIGFRYP